MTRYRKICLSIAALTSLLAIITICYISYKPTSENEPLDNGIYFFKCDSYLGFSSDEEISIQLPLIHYYDNEKKQSIPSFNSISLICDGNEVPVTSFLYQKGSETDKFTLYALLIKINSMNIGTYKINNVKIENQFGKYVYPIGDWLIDVRELVPNKDLNMGKRSSQIIGEFGSYTVELTNTLDNNIKISDMVFTLLDSYKININSYSDFDMAKVDQDLTLLPKQKKTFRFEMQNDKVDLRKKFVLLRPFVKYKINDEEKLYLLSTCIYSPTIDENFVIDYIKNFR